MAQAIVKDGEFVDVLSAFTLKRFLRKNGVVVALGVEFEDAAPALVDQAGGVLMSFVMDEQPAEGSFVVVRTVEADCVRQSYVAA